jgi:hypothetical protein
VHAVSVPARHARCVTRAGTRERVGLGNRDVGSGKFAK